jgi:acetyltransferase AlgX (SGNH hydrolase-like protein)
MKEQQPKKRAFVSVLGNVVLVLFGLTFALGLVEMLLREFPNWVPSEVRVNPPARRVKAFIDETYDLRQSDGDLYYYMRGHITPVSPDQDPVIAHVHMITDANGFRNSPPEKAAYGSVALGDSFTRASGVASPWPEKLAEYAGIDVLNLGDVGFGPQDELKVLQQYGLKKQPQWVILAYFEGNDLYDAASYEQANPFIVFRFGKYILNQSLEAWRDRGPAGAPADAARDYPYPITVTIDKKDLGLAFFSYYVAWLSADHEAIEASQNYRLAGETILQMRELSEAAGAHFLLVYVPSKEHVYLPYLNDPDTLARVFADVPTVGLDETGFLQFTNEKATPQIIRQHMDDQARLLTDFAVENDIPFLDLTPTFQEQAGTGAELYFPFDTHWNQLGHELAAASINEYLEKILPDRLGGTSGH